MKINRIIDSIKQSELVQNRTEDGAREIASQIIKEMEIDTYPIPIVSLLNELGFKVYTSTMPSAGISGFILINPELREKFGTDRVIAVSKDDSTGRQRFTLTHELAHYIFDFNENRRVKYFDTYNIQKADKESEAIPSRFAAEFLMPENLFVDRYKELKRKSFSLYEIVSTLMDDFNVTQKSVLKRFDELEIKWKD